MYNKKLQTVRFFQKITTFLVHFRAIFFYISVTTSLYVFLKILKVMSHDYIFNL